MQDSPDSPAADPDAPPSTDGAIGAGAEPVADASEAPGSAAVPAVRTVLVVDDNDGVRTVVRMMLRRAGYDVLEARNGVDALRKLDEARQPVDVVLTDMVMPAMSGGDLAHEVQKRYPAVALVLMSGYAPAVIDGRDSFSGIVFLTKPFTPKALLDGVAAALAGQAP